MTMSDKERKIMEPFLKTVRSNKNKTFKLGYSATGLVYICKYFSDGESENNLELNDPNYEEYWDVDFKVICCLVNNTEIEYPLDLFTVCYHNIPDIIEIID